MKRLAAVAAILGAGAVACNSPSETSVHPPDGGTGTRVELDGGGTPATPPDGASLCPKGVCNYQTNQGCTTGMSCEPIPSGTSVAPACNATSGTKTSGQACASQDECAPGYLCAEGACHKLCCGGDWTGCPSASEHCFVRVLYPNGQGGTIDTGAMLCYPVNTCDALDPTSCAAPGTTCQIVDPTGATACREEGTADVGQLCSSTTYCKGGLVCVQAADGYRCRRLCKAVLDVGATGCDASEICVHYVSDPEGVGECVSG